MINFKGDKDKEVKFYSLVREKKKRKTSNRPTHEVLLTFTRGGLAGAAWTSQRKRHASSQLSRAEAKAISAEERERERGQGVQIEK